MRMTDWPGKGRVYVGGAFDYIKKFIRKKKVLFYYSEKNHANKGV